MIKLTNILQEMKFSMYQTLVYVEFNDQTNITDIAQLIRSVRYVTVVNNKTDREDLKPRGLLEIKVITLKPGMETFEIVKAEALKSIPDLKKFKFSVQKLHKVDDI